MDKQIYHIIGMSPGNSYFSEARVKKLLYKAVEKFGRVAVLIPDIPAIFTYTALGYPENRARRDKAIPKGNALKNRVLNAMSELGYSSEQVKIIDWEKDVEHNPEYVKHYRSLADLYDNNKQFHSAAFEATKTVLINGKKDLKNIEKAVSIGVKYLLSEFAFMEFAPTFLKAPKVTSIYHNQWPVWENYISGKFDCKVKHHLEFLLFHLEDADEETRPVYKRAARPVPHPGRAA